MRNFIFLLCSMMGMTAVAQTVTTGHFEFGYPDRAALSIPKEFSFDNTPRLMLHRGNGEECMLQIYDENIELEKTISVANDKMFNYQLVYQDEERDVVAVNEVGKSSYCHFESYDEFVQREKNVDPSFDESQFIITELENGDKKISVDYASSRYSDNRSMYFAYDSFNLKYPKVYFIVSKSDGAVVGYRTSYSVVYSEWRAAGTHTENRQAQQRCISLCNVNLNQGDGAANSFFEVSQTLFNSDERYEYVVPKYKLVAKGNAPGNANPDFDDNSEKIITTRATIISENKELSLAGFQIVADDGAVIADLDFDIDDYRGSISIGYAYVITIGSSTYLAFNCADEDNPQGSIFFRINRKAGSVEKVKTLPAAMSVLPSVINRGAAMQISFPDGNERGSEIVITSASGVRMHSQHVPSMQTSASVSLSAPSGIYFVSRVHDGKAGDTKKIILR